MDKQLATSSQLARVGKKKSVKLNRPMTIALRSRNGRTGEVSKKANENAKKIRDAAVRRAALNRACKRARRKPTNAVVAVNKRKSTPVKSICLPGGANKRLRGTGAPTRLLKSGTNKKSGASAKSKGKVAVLEKRRKVMRNNASVDRQETSSGCRRSYSVSLKATCSAKKTTSLRQARRVEKRKVSNSATWRSVDIVSRRRGQTMNTVQTKSRKVVKKSVTETTVSMIVDGGSRKLIKSRTTRRSIAVKVKEQLCTVNTETEQQVKRKRGRPRKNPPNESMKANVTVTRKVLIKSSRVCENVRNSNESEAPVPRRRGRPPRNNELLDDPSMVQGETYAEMVERLAQAKRVAKMLRARYRMSTQVIRDMSKRLRLLTQRRTALRIQLKRYAAIRRQAMNNNRLSGQRSLVPSNRCMPTPVPI